MKKEETPTSLPQLQAGTGTKIAFTSFAGAYGLSATGFIFLIVGGILTITGIFAIIGIPFVVLGIILIILGGLVGLIGIGTGAAIGIKNSIKESKIKQKQPPTSTKTS